MKAESATILFDGVCNLCNGFVQFVIRHDPKGYFKFAALQSEVGQQLLRQYGMPAKDFKSVVLVKNGEVYTRSSAALQVFRHLSGGWSLLYAFAVVPSFLRNPLYDLVASNRYRLFGQQESCMMPSAELKARFL